ncbi:NDP-hexose 2,3-dehydratase family protein [Actinoplanes sp. NPDC051411]|uniref:NDP-hexose 2,3-dehydratase family protein n=1 Tax=Actinoplanes sp. NPDC051411 TaxID=3155522 RepID=UPI0034235E49
MFTRLADFHDWFAEQTVRQSNVVTRTGVDDLPGWRIDPDSGNLVHDTGRFFSVSGLDVVTDHRDSGRWRQPIIIQSEIGILGLLVKVLDGEVYCLMQAKMEPGNINLVQVSPTVQATRSNYSRVHGGSDVPYLEYFVAPRRGRIVFDALQSEQGSWFLKKRNRNMIVQVDADVPARDGFCWLSVTQIAQLLQHPNLINMDARTVLSGILFVESLGPTRAPHPEGPSLYPFGHVLSWLSEARSSYHLTQRPIPLRSVPRWHWTGAGELVHDTGRYFSVIGVHVAASDREVRQWSQPLLKPVGRGVIGFLARRVGGVYHLLTSARTEAGTRDVVEVGATVSCNPVNYAAPTGLTPPRYLGELLAADASRVLVDVVHSEEGGRFFGAENRYLIVDVGEDFDLDVPDDYCWMTLDQIITFVRFGNTVNVAARCLLTCLVGLLERGREQWSPESTEARRSMWIA